MKLRILFAAALAVSAYPAAAEAGLFDVHVHLHSGEASLRGYDAQLEASGRQVSGYGAMWFGGPNRALHGDPDAIRANNDALLALARRDPRMLPIVTVHPYDGEEALAELARTAAGGARVVKIHPHTQGFDAADPRVLALVRRAGELGLVVLMDNANIVPGDSEKLFNLALAAPGTKFLFAHIGGMNFRFWNILKAARTAEGLFGNNIYFDISAIVALVADSPVADEFVWTLRNVGIEHVLLGSDYPQYSLDQNVEALGRLGLSENELDRIRLRNANELFGLTALQAH
ncbi:amidohydrolase family protein [Sphingosinicella terrae]|uniref:amidohydrolase family protein n=1 Tax=Sphingosinicella terrae TaxID=2172047 RepID=UPI00254712B9|nr:amidohydrolase family protein [Sphingosinicella terrae]